MLDALAAVGGADAAVAAVAAGPSATGDPPSAGHSRRTPSADGSSMPGSMASPTSAGAVLALHPVSNLVCGLRPSVGSRISLKCLTHVFSAG